MFEDLLPAMEKSILEASGSIPVVFEGIEHSFEKSTPVPTASRHTSHELMYLRSGRTEFIINGKPVMEHKELLTIDTEKMEAEVSRVTEKLYAFTKK